MNCGNEKWPWGLVGWVSVFSQLGADLERKKGVVGADNVAVGNDLRWVKAKVLWGINGNEGADKVYSVRKGNE